MSFPGVEAAWKVSSAFGQAFVGNGWRSVVFQAYSMLFLAGYSAYRMTRNPQRPAVILSMPKLNLSLLFMSAMYVLAHQAVIAFNPADAGIGRKATFVVASFVLLTLIPYHLGNFFTYLVTNGGREPYLLDPEMDDKMAFWARDEQFVRRVAALYYMNSLYIPFLIFSLSRGLLQLVLTAGWLLNFVLLMLLRIHGIGSPVLIGYFVTLGYAAFRHLP